FIVSELRHFRDERSRTSGFFPYLHCLVFKEHSAVLSLLPFATAFIYYHGLTTMSIFISPILNNLSAIYSI
ncbi:MAG: hypothetical protein ABFC57_13925, partial [Veillonellales bacterium]